MYHPLSVTKGLAKYALYLGEELMDVSTYVDNNSWESPREFIARAEEERQRKKQREKSLDDSVSTIEQPEW